MSFHQPGSGLCALASSSLYHGSSMAGQETLSGTRPSRGLQRDWLLASVYVLWPDDAPGTRDEGEKHVQFLSMRIIAANGELQRVGIG